MRQFIIFGNTSFALRIASYIDTEGIDKVVAFTQESAYADKTEIGDRPILPFEDLGSFYELDSFYILIGIGYSQMNELREKIYHKCRNNHYHIGTYISKRALCYSDKISEGCIILPGALIGPNSRIGICNYFESNCVLSHDNTIGNFNFLSTNAILGGGPASETIAS